MTSASAEFDFSAVVRHGDHVSWPQGTGEPTGLTAALVAATPDLPQYVAMLGVATTATPSKLVKMGAEFLCLNAAAGTRPAAAQSGTRIVPAHVSAVPGLIRARLLPVDVVLIRARPTTNPAILSVGVIADFVQEMIDTARVVIAEIDDRLPITGDDALVARDRIHHFTMADGAEPIIPDAVPSETEREVARRVAELIPDRATIQLGVGGLPTAVCGMLTDHKDLGIHSGVVPDCIVNLLECGVVTNLYKGVDTGRTVTGGLFGDRRLFDFADSNNAISMRSASYTHAATTMAALNRFHTVNSAIEIDLSGQINSEDAAGRYIGAVGGQIDFAARAKALISIAHPDFRSELERSLHASLASIG